MFTSTEWDYRAPTLSEQVEHLRHTWDGPRCPHGQPVNAPGPDLICGHCEAEENALVQHEQYLEDLDATGVHPWPIGPDRHHTDATVRLGFTERIDHTSDDGVPF